MEDAKEPTNVIDFPAGQPQGTVNDMPEGAKQFYAAASQLATAIETALGPFAEQHPMFADIRREANRYLELTTMYVERGMMYARNPHVQDMVKQYRAQLEELKQKQSEKNPEETDDASA